MFEGAHGARRWVHGVGTRSRGAAARRSSVAAALVALACGAAAGCDRGPSCEGLLGEGTVGPIPPAWSAVVEFAPGAIACGPATERDVRVVERTALAVPTRANQARDQLVAAGWSVVAGKEGPGASDSYHVTLERGAEALVLTVHPVLDPGGKRSLALHLGIVPKGRPRPAGAATAAP